MRQDYERQHRYRNRNRNKGQNLAQRSLDSNGPDVKIRGTAAHICKKYQTLARDAQLAGNRIRAENYLQHADHYYRIVMLAQQQQQQNQHQPRDQQSRPSQPQASLAQEASSSAPPPQQPPSPPLEEADKPSPSSAN